MKVRDVIKAMEKDGWVIDRTRGDHRQFRHPGRPEAGTVTVPGQVVSEFCVEEKSTPLAPP